MAATRKVAAMPRIFAAGAQLAAPYGAEIAQPLQEIIKELERTAAMASLGRPMAVPVSVKPLWYPYAQHRLVKAKVAPIARWAKEVWQSTYEAPGALTKAHLTHVWRAVRFATADPLQLQKALRTV